MAFDLARIRAELQSAALPSPYPRELAAAIVSDVFRMAGARPPARMWKAFGKRRGSLKGDQLGMLAHVLATTSTRAESVAVLRADADAEAVLASFFEAIDPLTAEMIRSNAFRQEEFLRRWAECIGGTIAGESARESQRRLERLDYRQTLEEYGKAAAARKAEADRRAKALAEAAAREAAARGWRE